MGKGSTPLLAMASMIAMNSTLLEQNPFRGMIGTVFNGPSYKGIMHNKRRRGRRPK